MSRVRCTQLAGPRADLLEDCRTALNTTEDSLRKLTNHSLCHGQLGNAELFLMAGQHDPSGRSAAGTLYADGAPRLAREVLDDVHAGAPWRCGTVTGQPNRGLMTGFAGIGRFFLRLQDPAMIPSVLVVPGPAYDAGQEVS
jgi:lantibiotic modifying enzyme